LTCLYVESLMTCGLWLSFKVAVFGLFILQPMLTSDGVIHGNGRKSVPGRAEGRF
jgi:hypothetical protein